MSICCHVSKFRRIVANIFVCVIAMVFARSFSQLAWLTCSWCHKLPIVLSRKLSLLQGLQLQRVDWWLSYPCFKASIFSHTSLPQNIYCIPCIYFVVPAALARSFSLLSWLACSWFRFWFFQSYSREEYHVCEVPNTNALIPTGTSKLLFQMRVCFCMLQFSSLSFVSVLSCSWCSGALGTIVFAVFLIGVFMIPLLILSIVLSRRISRLKSSEHRRMDSDEYYVVDARKPLPGSAPTQARVIR